MSKTTVDILELISPEYNTPLDEELHERIMSVRSAVIELEKNKTDANPIPLGSKTVLQQILELERETCTFVPLMFYCQETAHAYQLNDNVQKALEYAASALACAQILENSKAQAEIFELLFKIALFGNDFQMALGFLEQHKQIEALSEEMEEAYKSLEAVIENGIEAPSKFRIEEGELPIASCVLELLERGPVEMAARLIRRASGMTTAQAKAEAESLSEAQLGTMFGR